MFAMLIFKPPRLTDAVQRAQMQNVLLAAALRIAVSECFWHSTAQSPDTTSGEERCVGRPSFKLKRGQ